jgi:hypothetical protein
MIKRVQRRLSRSGVARNAVLLACALGTHGRRARDAAIVQLSRNAASDWRCE